MAKLANSISLHELHKYFYIENSQLKWKLSTNTKIRIGNIAGHIHHNGYWVLRLLGIHYAIHRIMYQMYNEIEILDSIVLVDHINKIKTDNSKNNLRIALSNENSYNSKKSIQNTSGHKKISHQKWIDNRNGLTREYWQVCIRSNGTIHKRKFEYSELGLLKAIEYRNNVLPNLHYEFSSI